MAENVCYSIFCTEDGGFVQNLWKVSYFLSQKQNSLEDAASVSPWSVYASGLGADISFWAEKIYLEIYSDL